MIDGNCVGLNTGDCAVLDVLLLDVVTTIHSNTIIKFIRFNTTGWVVNGG